MPKITKDNIHEAESLQGKYTRRDAKLSEIELLVAKHQGLIDDDGLLKESALFKPRMSAVPDGFSAPVPLEDLVADPEKLTQKIEDIKAEHADEAAPDETKQVEVGLPPPEFSAGEPSAEPDPPPGGERPTNVTELRELVSGFPEAVRCPHCAWDQRDNSFKPPTFEEEDKMAFVRHVMSPEGRFFKTYDLYGGALQIQLQSRTQRELEAILEAARQDMKDEKIIGMGDLTSQLQRYHIAASVSRVADTTDETNTKVYKTLENALEEKSAVEAVREMNEAVFGTGQAIAFYDSVTAIWLDHQRLYAYLTSRAHEADFWKAVAGDHS